MEITPENEKRIAAVATTGPLMVCELRGQKQNQIRWSDKKTGERKSMEMLELSLELSDGTHVAAEMFAPREHVGPVPMLPAPKGSTVLAGLRELKSENGVTKARLATLEILQIAGEMRAAAVAAAPVAEPAASVGKSGKAA